MAHRFIKEMIPYPSHRREQFARIEINDPFATTRFTWPAVPR